MPLQRYKNYFLGAHAQARYTVVCWCVCVDCYSCSRINEVQVRVSIDFNSWICKIMLRSRVMAGLLTWNAIVAFSEQRVAKLVHVVLLLYLAVSFALER